MKFLNYALCALVTCYLSSQNVNNLSLEQLSNDKAIGWTVFGDGDHKISFEKGIAQDGNVSGVIENQGSNAGFRALAYNIPADFGGKKIKLTGFLKTENVTDGFAGLW
ncbi:MAG: peptidase S41, partial [Bacteroidota bacterium]